MTQKITREFALTQLRKLVAEKGEDFIYTPPGSLGGCFYAWPASHDINGDPMDYAPSCGVGWVVDQLDHDALVAIGIREFDADESFSVDDLFGTRLLPTEAYDEDGVKTLQAFQSMQDTGVPYGKCLEYVEDMDLSGTVTAVSRAAERAARNYRFTDGVKTGV